MSRKVVEVTVIISALPILKAFEIDLSRLLLFCFVDAFAKFGKVVETVNGIHKVKLKSPNDISSIFNVAALLKGFKGNGMNIVGTVERTDDNESSVSVALKFFELANGIINTEFGRIATVGNDLQVIKANNRSFGFIHAKGTE